MNLLSRWHVLGFLLVALGLILGACASDSTASQPDPSSTQSEGSNLPDANQGPLAGDFSVITGSETNFSLNDHEGEVVVLYFSFPG